MRMIYMGTGAFAIPSLKALLQSDHQVVGVVTQPDRPAGRGRQLRISAIKEIALDAGLPVYQPEKVRSDDFVELMRTIAPDVIVVAAFGQLIPQSILDIPKFGNVNVHGSLLPKYRGAAPVHYALFNGETCTGVTTMLMAKGLDTGPMLLKQEVPILPEDNEGTLEPKLADAGAKLLILTLDRLEQGEITPIPQDDQSASYAPSVKKDECRIDWSQSAVAIVNRVRGCTPRPGAYTYWKTSPLKVWACRVADESGIFGNPGDVSDVTSIGILVCAGSGRVLLTEVQPENKKRMDATEFARGYRVTNNTGFYTS